MKVNRESWRLGALMGMGLGVRLTFLFWGATRYYGAGVAPYVNGDTQSFAQSFINLVRIGHYTFDPAVPDASFGRLPGYPLFWGLHYLVFGESGVYLAVALTQALLDTVGIYLIFAIVRNSGAGTWAPWIAAAALAFYPFTLVWVTVSGSESFGVFLCLLFFYLMTRDGNPGHRGVVLGLLAGFAFLTRPYLLAFVPAAAAYAWLSGAPTRRVVRQMAWMVTALAVVYLPWPVRNWVNHGQLVLIKTPSTGYARFAPDFAGFRSWVYAWQEGLEPYHARIIETDGPLGFPDWPFENAQEKARAQALVARARVCGTGFRAWRFLPPPTEPCDREVAAGFDSLRTAYTARHPLRTALVVPLLNLRKALFKSRLQASTVQTAAGGGTSRLLFAWRSLWVLLGWLGIAVLWRRPTVMAVAVVSGSIYLAFAFVFRQIEMRYLLQADALLLVPAALLVGLVLEGIRDRVSGATSPG